MITLPAASMTRALAGIATSAPTATMRLPSMTTVPFSIVPFVTVMMRAFLNAVGSAWEMTARASRRVNARTPQGYSIDDTQRGIARRMAGR